MASSQTLFNKPTLHMHDPDADGEAMTLRRFYDEPIYKILGYLNEEIKPIEKSCDAETHKTQYAKFRFFGLDLQQILKTDLTKLADLILRGEVRDISQLLEVIRAKPILLHIETIGTDPLGRNVKGTLLQIAAMAGDTNLKDGHLNESERGLVERLILAGNISQQEVSEQLSCITSAEAQLQNKQRNEKIVSAIRRFGESILDTKLDSTISFNEYQLYCEIPIKQFNDELAAIAKETIQSGFIFDIAVLQSASQWFIENMDRFGRIWNHKSELFLINGYGKLQSQLSARDAQIIKAGMGNLIDSGTLPARSLMNADGTSYFYQPGSPLGMDLFLEYSGSSYKAENLGVGTDTLSQVKLRALQMLAETPALRPS